MIAKTEFGLWVQQYEKHFVKRGVFLFLPEKSQTMCETELPQADWAEMRKNQQIFIVSDEDYAFEQLPRLIQGHPKKGLL